jgi:hypothetical protein
VKLSGLDQCVPTDLPPSLDMRVELSPGDPYQAARAHSGPAAGTDGSRVLHPEVLLNVLTVVRFPVDLD